jgi:formate hydrogenlyase transcriptional activator
LTALAPPVDPTGRSVGPDVTGRVGYTAPVSPAQRTSPADQPGARLAFETLIADTSAALLAAPTGELDAAIETALERVRVFFMADRSALLSVSADQQVVKVQLAAYSEGTSRVSTDLNLAPLFPWSRRLLLERNTPVRLSSIADLPPEADAERAMWIELPIRAALTLPIATGGIVRYLILLNTVQEDHEWPDEFVTRLRVLGEMLAGALERRHIVAGLLIADARLASAADLAGLGFYEADFTVPSMYVDERMSALCGFPPDRLHGLEPLAFWMEHLHPDDRARVMAARDQLQDGTLDRLSIEYRYLQPDRGEQWFHHLAGVAVRDAAKRALRTYGVLREITERRRAEEALRKSYAEIEQLKDRLQAETDYLKAEMRVTRTHGEITGQSGAIQSVLRQIEQVAPTSATVLVCGETGTGKELVAQAIHRLSPRGSRLMVKVNCGALPSGLVESELFGREKGAFTGALTRQIGRFEVADGSTLFLDEIGEVPLEVQAKLLRVLETGEFQRLGSPRSIKVNVRLIAATNRDLEEDVRQGRFREDLYYRLNVFPIEVPPLRQRAEDIPLLVWAFLEELNARMGKRITQVPRTTMEALQARSWPGNVRELRNVIEHAVIVAVDGTLRVPQLPKSARRTSVPLTLEDVERDHILRTLESTGGRIKGPGGAAGILAINPATLYSRMKKLGIERRR